MQTSDRLVSFLAIGFLFPISGVAMTPSPHAIEMTVDQWLPDAGLHFLKRKGYPHGVMQVKGPGAVLKGITFGSGTIEYDINEDDDPDETSGIWFRRTSAKIAENVYLRPFAGCEATQECIQYAPVSRGNVQWGRVIRNTRPLLL